jgi:hypothetical protein
MIKISIGGRTVDPGNIQDAHMRAVLGQIREQITQKVGTIRDPNTGEFPTIIIRGDNLDNIKFHIEGSPEVIALVKARLGIDDDNNDETNTVTQPKVFLSYTTDNLELAKRVAEALQQNGIETWWDRWCINPGDSLRQKIDEGISGCTHFLVLLTEQSIKQPWVNQEMDAGLVRKLHDQCKFLPVRYKLKASALPPLLSGMHSPQITTDADIQQLINDIYGVTRKPPRGVPPPAVSTSAHLSSGYSAAATTIAKYFVDHTSHGLFADPQIEVEDLAQKTGLSIEDTRDALYELSGMIKVPNDHVLVQGTLFSEFDQYWKPWKPSEDALRIGADILNNPEFPSDCKEIADLYGWEPRRLNPSISYLLERQLIIDYRVLGNHPWAALRIVGNDGLRRFVKSRA